MNGVNQTTSRRFRLIPDDPMLGWTPYAYLIYVVFFAIEPLLDDSPRWQLMATWGGLLVFLVAYFRGHWLQGWRILPVIVLLCLLGAGFGTFNMGASAFFIYASAFAVNLGPPKRVVRAVLAILGVVAVTALWIQPMIFFWLPAAVFVPLIGFLVLHQRTVTVAQARLRLSQDEVARLAKVAERERIARDLHDVLGHTLSLITLKSSLAGRLVGRDPDRAEAEIRDIERIAREATKEVRHAVIGYRTRSLDEEIVQARAALDAAGVQLDVTLDPVALDAMQEGVLSLALREAVTNVVRHARATQCRVTLHLEDTAVRLAIEDDGRGPSEVADQDQEGSGLAGMRERVMALGGQLERSCDSGTRLVISLPRTVTAPGAGRHEALA